jgi:hypothetical protein
MCAFNNSRTNVQFIIDQPVCIDPPGQLSLYELSLTGSIYKIIGINAFVLEVHRLEKNVFETHG